MLRVHYVGVRARLRECAAHILSLSPFLRLRRPLSLSRPPYIPETFSLGLGLLQRHLKPRDLVPGGFERRLQVVVGRPLARDSRRQLGDVRPLGVQRRARVRRHRPLLRQPEVLKLHWIWGIRG